MAADDNEQFHCDLLIEGAELIDGSGDERVRADVAIRGDRIVAVGDLKGMDAAATIDASGLVVAPGFIDAHTHDDRAVMSTPDMTPKLSQGVTTVVTGNCGISLAPLANREPVPPLNLLGSRDCFRYTSMSEYMAEFLCKLDTLPDAGDHWRMRPLEKFGFSLAMKLGLM